MILEPAFIGRLHTMQLSFISFLATDSPLDGLAAICEPILRRALT